MVNRLEEVETVAETPVTTGTLGDRHIIVDFGKATGTGAAALGFVAKIANMVTDAKNWAFPVVIAPNSRMGKNAMQVAGKIVGEGDAANSIGLSKGKHWTGRAFNLDVNVEAIARMDAGQILDLVLFNLGKIACLNRTDNAPVPALDKKTGILTRMPGKFEDWYERELGVSCVVGKTRGEITAVHAPKSQPRLYDDEERRKTDPKCLAYAWYLWVNQNADVKKLLGYARDEFADNKPKPPATRGWIAPCGDKITGKGKGVFLRVDCLCKACTDKETGMGSPFAPLDIGSNPLPDHLVTAERIRAHRASDALAERFMAELEPYDKAVLDAREDRKVEKELEQTFKGLTNEQKRELLAKIQ